MTKPTGGFFTRNLRDFDYTGDVVNPLTGEVTHPPSMTKQEFIAECDINNIVKEFLMTGIFNHISANAQEGRYEDLPDQMDYQQAIHTMRAAEASFASLPARVRERFQNDPGQFLAFCEDPKNAAEMVELGLATRSEPDSRVGEAVQEVPAPKDPA